MFTGRFCGGRRGDVAAVDADGARLGASKPAISRSNVVLPQPDGPSSVKNSLSPIVRLTDLTASTSGPPLTGNDFDTLSMAIICRCPSGEEHGALDGGDREKVDPEVGRASPQAQT